MARYAYKMFNKDLTCTKGKGIFQYDPGVWYEEEEANCVRNGFHCAENPLDCLSYYPDWDRSVCYQVEIGGDVDEDARDSKISCTRIRLVRKLTLENFVLEACTYIIDHPHVQNAPCVKLEEGSTGGNPFVIVRGRNPKAKGKKGDIIAILQNDEKGEIMAAGMYKVGEKGNVPGFWYDAYGRIVQ